MTTESRGIRRIVVGVDGSPGAAGALRWTVDLASALGAEVIVVHAVELTTYDTRPLGLPVPILNEAAWRDSIREELEGTGAGRWWRRGSPTGRASSTAAPGRARPRSREGSRPT